MFYSMYIGQDSFLWIPDDVGHQHQGLLVPAKYGLKREKTKEQEALTSSLGTASPLAPGQCQS